jgi:hypothetical protein
MSRPACIAAALLSLTAAAPPRDAAAAFVMAHHLTRYLTAHADLNGDGRPETFIYAIDGAGGGPADYCGSGGCTLYVLSPGRHGERRVMSATATQLPIRLLATRTHGWRDIGVMVGGGGIIPSYEARLRFDGHRYPGNPTVPPAERMTDIAGTMLVGPMKPPS